MTSTSACGMTKAHKISWHLKGASSHRKLDKITSRVEHSPWSHWILPNCPTHTSMERGHQIIMMMIYDLMIMLSNLSLFFLNKTKVLFEGIWAALFFLLFWQPLVVCDQIYLI